MVCASYGYNPTHLEIDAFDAFLKKKRSLNDEKMKKEMGSFKVLEQPLTKKPRFEE